MNDIAAYYDHLADLYGHDPRAVDAPDQESLGVRYQALGDVCDMNRKSVLEVGCGYGGLGAYLTERYPEIDYRGIEISSGLLMLGREAYPELRLYGGELLALQSANPYDVVLAQGIFYKLSHHPWEKSKRLIAKMYALAGEVSAFTALIDLEKGFQAGERDDPELHDHDPGLGAAHEYRLDAARTRDYCRSLSGLMTYRDDYHRGDALFTLHRKAQ